jgi:lysophospholipase L1-like esterase
VRDVLKTPPASYPANGTHPDCNPTDPYRGDSSDLARWFDTQQPDVVLMHFGTNDLWSGAAPAAILSAYSAILSKLRSRNPSVKVYVAQVIPLQPDTQKDYTALATALNSAIPGWATQNNQASSPIVVVDQFTGFNATADTSDGVHPTAAGSEKMAQKWFDALKTLF